MRVTWITLALGLSGCAAQMLETQKQAAMQAPAAQVCYLAVAGHELAQQASWYAIRERGINCEQHQATVNAALERNRQAAQQNQQNMQNAINVLQAAQPRPAPMPQQTVCRTVVIGNALQTVCN